VGVVLTWVLPTTLEDALAIVLAGLAGYVALLNLPLRRAEAKAKLERVANNFIQVRRAASKVCKGDFKLSVILESPDLHSDLGGIFAIEELPPNCILEKAFSEQITGNSSCESPKLYWLPEDIQRRKRMAMHMRWPSNLSPFSLLLRLRCLSCPLCLLICSLHSIQRTSSLAEAWVVLGRSGGGGQAKGGAGEQPGCMRGGGQRLHTAA
jgi:hypothetical protein